LAPYQKQRTDLLQLPRELAVAALQVNHYYHVLPCKINIEHLTFF